MPFNDRFRLIAHTSVVTFSIAGIVKEILTIAVSSLIFGDDFPILKGLGLIISLIGISMYNWFRIQGILAAKERDLEIFQTFDLDTSDEDELLKRKRFNPKYAVEHV